MIDFTHLTANPIPPDVMELGGKLKQATAVNKKQQQILIFGLGVMVVSLIIQFKEAYENNK